MLVLIAALAGAAGAAAPPPAWQYDVTAGADELRVEATLDDVDGPLVVDEAAAPFVREVELVSSSPASSSPSSGPAPSSPARLQPLLAIGGAWPGCPRRCRVRYRFLLRAAADALDSEIAARSGDVVQAPPSSWLLRPRRAPVGDYRLRMHAAPGSAFVTGLAGDAERGVYQAPAQSLDDAPYSAFGPLAVKRLAIGGGELEIAIAPATRALAPEAMVSWARRSAGAVVRYYGRLPLARILLLVLPRPGCDAEGKTLGGGGATVMLRVGDAMTESATVDDWVLTHELVHVALPSLPRAQRWLEEGLATYVEPLARARAGELSPARVWRDLVEGLPQGLPTSAERGLDGTRSWGRTYWGGALFCLLADVEIRERTNNRRSLDDALRGILAAGGSAAVRWPLERILDEGDRATGVAVLSSLHARMGTRRLDVDLPSLWRRLGVHLRGARLELDDAAPLAAIRRSITAPAGPLTAVPRP